MTLVGWLLATGWWLHEAFSYSAQPGARSVATTRLPRGLGLDLDPERPTLVVFAHPQCPCTRATLEELQKLISRAGGGIRTHVLFYSDPRMGTAWTRDALWKRVESIPGVTAAEDPLARTALLLGARTSGHAFLFAPDGALLFDGGLTAARGHEGDNPGAAAVLSLWRGTIEGPASTPVFGCSLTGDA